MDRLTFDLRDQQALHVRCHSISNFWLRISLVVPVDSVHRAEFSALLPTLRRPGLRTALQERVQARLLLRDLALRRFLGFFTLRPEAAA
jgi:hypothetical protein